MKVKKHILIVDDVTTNLKCVGEILRNDYALSMAKSGEQALQMIGKVKPDLVLLDVKMPGMDGYETFKAMKDNPETSDIPVIFLTADTENGSEVKGLRLGASDFIRKPYEPEIMLGRIEKALVQEEKNKAIRDEAYKDALTGLWNRKHLQDELDSLKDSDSTGSFLIFDLDNFKGINDNYGHVVGDAALVAFAKTLKNFVHKDDIVARIGGDEFAVFLRNSYGKELLSDRIENLITEVEHEIKVVKEDDSYSSVSIGISAFPFDGKTFIELYNNADKALYYVKQNGKSGYHFYNPGEKYSFTDEENKEVIDLFQLKKYIDEEDFSDGPFKVEYNSFKSIYRFLKRYVMRTNSKIQIILFSLKDLSIIASDNTAGLNKSMIILDECIKDSLRKNDVSTRYTSTQFLVILMDVDEVKRQSVVDRIMNNWNENNNNPNVLLKYDIEELKSEG